MEFGEPEDRGDVGVTSPVIRPLVLRVIIFCSDLEKKTATVLTDDELCRGDSNLLADFFSDEPRRGGRGGGAVVACSICDDGASGTKSVAKSNAQDGRRRIPAGIATVDSPA